ncbi:PREDICTED: acyl-coenzyme A thioesterase 13 isoform X2 [Tarenaya hassleriana]|uniref:acyl-coenzyme A thioesterase 13 isoform X2 n=1 Tax=Tarenaya hassleriana TaxID=28532 RepID=UPI00053C34D6|nr:PREDICTED: acyl-coenzyme A thioesterase 13 isoform X2 [Tarenaya hassleriana]XP_010544707.1 PREDICTED: acyl-coenzyme A thioesterase 13 isoform X2 [Tarenaya hassleriana]XP_010544708.1 PREDICTED: acyl-coenzyme A thioesterase 13 isoform X2 [Tarenaya hassleriana]
MSPSEAVDPKHATAVVRFFENIGVSGLVGGDFTSADSFSDIICHYLTALSVARGRVTCSLSVQPSLVNVFKGLHGGVVASVAERVAIACARTVVAEDKQLFLGELSISYLSSAPLTSEVVVEGSLVRSGRNLTVVTVEFKIKDTKKLAYIARATFYNLPTSKL